MENFVERKVREEPVSTFESIVSALLQLTTVTNHAFISFEISSMFNRVMQLHCVYRFLSPHFRTRCRFFALSSSSIATAEHVMPREFCKCFSLQAEDRATSFCFTNNCKTTMYVECQTLPEFHYVYLRNDNSYFLHVAQLCVIFMR